MMYVRHLQANIDDGKCTPPMFNKKETNNLDQTIMCQGVRVLNKEQSGPNHYVLGHQGTEQRNKLCET